jgi:hypothetical protein
VEPFLRQQEISSTHASIMEGTPFHQPAETFSTMLNISSPIMAADWKRRERRIATRPGEQGCSERELL